MVSSGAPQRVSSEGTGLEAKGESRNRSTGVLPYGKVQSKRSMFSLNYVRLDAKAVENMPGVSETDSLRCHVIAKETGEEKESQDFPIDSTSLQESTSSCQSSANLQDSVSDNSMNRREMEDSITLFDVPPGAISFRHFYFRPIVIKGSKPGEWLKASNVHSNIRFLRNARYLEKLVKDYDLSSVLCHSSNLASQQAAASFHGDPHQSVSKISSPREMTSRLSYAEKDGVSLDERQITYLDKGKPFTPASIMGEDTSHATYLYTSNATGAALLNKGKRKTEAALLRRFPKLASAWSSVKGSFIGSLFRLPRRMSSSLTRKNKVSKQDIELAGPSSVTEVCVSLSEASLLQPSLSSQQYGGRQGYLSAIDGHSTNGHSVFGDRNRSAAEPQAKEESEEKKSSSKVDNTKMAASHSSTALPVESISKKLSTNVDTSKKATPVSSAGLIVEPASEKRSILSTNVDGLKKATSGSSIAVNLKSPSKKSSTNVDNAKKALSAAGSSTTISGGTLSTKSSKVTFLSAPVDKHPDTTKSSTAVDPPKYAARKSRSSLSQASWVSSLIYKQ